MSNYGGIVLEFNGNKYNLHSLTQIAGSAPRIDIENIVFNNDISKHDEEIAAQFKVTYHNGTPPPAKELIVFKQEGGYTILLGHDLLADETLTKAKHSKARLISTPALKKTRFEKDAPVGDPPTVERVLNSAASGPMADKMQQAFTGAPKRYESNHTQRLDRSTERNSVTGTHKPAGYSDMTSHQGKLSLAEINRAPAPQVHTEAGLNHPTGVRPRAHQFGTGKKKV